MTRVALCIACIALLGCGESPDTPDAASMDSGTAPDGAVGTDAGTPTLDAEPPRLDAGADGGPMETDAGRPPPMFPICVLGCVVDADCGTPSPAFDTDNYRCDDGTCVYTGCIDDGECQSTFGSMDYGCRSDGMGLPICVETCTVSADCGSGSSAFDADNYACESGSCRYLGCHTDDECEGTFGATFGCVEAEPPTTPIPIPVAARNCIRRCSAVSECASDMGAFGADNYECTGGFCGYTGCNGDVECQMSLGNSAYVCR